MFKALGKTRMKRQKQAGNVFSEMAAAAAALNLVGSARAGRGQNASQRKERDSLFTEQLGASHMLPPVILKPTLSDRHCECSEQETGFIGKVAKLGSGITGIQTQAGPNSRAGALPTESYAPDSI